MADLKLDKQAVGDENERKQIEDYITEVEQLTLEISRVNSECKLLNDELYKIKTSKNYRLGKFLLAPLRFGNRAFKKMKRIAKGVITFNGEALKTELFMPVIKIKHKLSTTQDKQKFLNEFAPAIAKKTLIIFPPTIDWDIPLFQRPQQLAKAYARRKDTCVLYISPMQKDDHFNFGKQVDEDLYVVNVYHIESVLPILDTASKKILSISWAINDIWVDKIKPNNLIYEYIDELEIFNLYGPELVVKHNSLIAKADVTVSTATKLYDQVKNASRNPILSTNGGDYEFFAKTKDTQPHHSIAEIKAEYECVLGYYGALAQWFDYELVAEVAKRKPNWAWVLVGLDYDKTIHSSGVLDLPNVKFLGPKPYKELPAFLTAFDIATIPFIINEITLSTSPVKLFEYMAGGKPILTSKMPECFKYESVYTYGNCNEFISKAEQLLAVDSTNTYWNILEKEALENTWDAKVSEILSALNY